MVRQKFTVIFQVRSCLVRALSNQNQAKMKILITKWNRNKIGLRKLRYKNNKSKWTTLMMIVWMTRLRLRMTFCLGLLSLWRLRIRRRARRLRKWTRCYFTNRRLRTRILSRHVTILSYSINSCMSIAPEQESLVSSAGTSPEWELKSTREMNLNKLKICNPIIDRPRMAKPVQRLFKCRLLWKPTVLWWLKLKPRVKCSLHLNHLRW